MQALCPLLRPHHQPITAHRMRGFTLIEVMVVVGILAVLAVLAAPSFTPLIDKWRIEQAIDNMKSTIYYARSEAVKRGGSIGVEKSKNIGSCKQASTNQEWGCGWFVFVDTNGNGTWTKGEEVLQTIPPPTNLNVMHRGGGTNINVNRYGMMSGHNGKGFSFASEAAGVGASSARSLCMSSGGRIRITKEVPCPKK